MSNRINYLMENWERAEDGGAFLGNVSDTDLREMAQKYLRRGEDGLAAEVRKEAFRRKGGAIQPRSAETESEADEKDL